MSVQDELELGVPEPAGLTEADVCEALYARYGQVHGNGRRYAVAAQVRSRAGFDARRTADFVAMDLWPSAGLTLHGHEVKVSRSDWLRELKDPSKAAEFIPYMNTWWVVVSDRRIVREGELPDDWGLMAMRGTQLTVIKKALRRDALPMNLSRLAALLRAITQTAEFRARREHERRYRCHSRHIKCSSEEDTGFSPERMSELVLCGCTQVPELGPCEHQRGTETGGAA
jgi:hypothetical protein